MAENNSSAPLKTAPMIEAFEAAYSRDWNDPAGDEIKEIWHRAWQAAVAAQAAPAAVAVPAIADSFLSCAIADSNYAAGMLLGWNLCVADDSEKFSSIRSDRMSAAIQASRAARANPALPATKAAPVAVAVPASIPSLSGDAALAHEQCRAVVHLALAVAEVYSANALIVASDSRLADQIGAASAEVMEFLGDTLNSTDATTEEDEWLDPIFEGAQKRWPATEDSSAGDQAEVQAEPVAWINHPVIVDSAGNFAGYGHPELSFKQPPCGFAFDKAQALYTAPQAQPATATFEAWAKLVGGAYARTNCGPYERESMKLAAMAWQASAATTAAPQAQPADALDAAPAAPINSEALQVIKALREWVMAVPADVAAALPAMPGIDADWMDAVEAALATHSAPADGLMVDMTPPATSRDRWMYNQGRLAEVEHICAAIKTEDDYCVDQGDYMLDSDDCIKVARGTWLRPTFDRAAMAAAQEGGNAAKEA